MASSKTMQASDHMSAGVEYLAPSSTCNKQISHQSAICYSSIYALRGNPCSHAGTLKHSPYQMQGAVHLHPILCRKDRDGCGQKISPVTRMKADPYHRKP